MADAIQRPTPLYLKTPDAALRLGLSPRTLEKHRCYGTGPAFHKLGGSVVYAIEALDAWANLGLKRSTSDPGRGGCSPAKRLDGPVAWVSGGRDRALARTAFADELPSDIVNRRTKGGPSGFTDRLYWENECAVLEFLRSGRLVQSGILEHLPAHSLSNSPNRQPTDPRRLLYLAAAEAWVRSWEA